MGLLHVTRVTETSDKSSLERRFKLKGRRRLNRILTYGHTKLTSDTFCLSFFRKKYTKMSQLHPFYASREANKFQEHCPLRGSPSQPGHWGLTPVRGFSGLFCSPQHAPHTHHWTPPSFFTTGSTSSDSHVISIGLMRVTLTCEADSLPPTENQSP